MGEWSSSRRRPRRASNKYGGLPPRSAKKKPYLYGENPEREGPMKIIGFMGEWSSSRRRPRRTSKYGGLPPRSGDSYSSVPPWEKKFCSQIPWEKFCEGKKLTHLYENVIEWDDSAGKECFDNAKARFWAKINGLRCDIPVPDPDMYIDVVDQDAVLDPQLVEDLYNQPPPPPPREEPDFDSIEIIATGWDVENPYGVVPRVPLFISAGEDQSLADPSRCGLSENPILATNEPVAIAPTEPVAIAPTEPVAIAPTGWGDEEDVGPGEEWKSSRMRSESREMDGKDWNFGRMNCGSWGVRKERSWEHNGCWNSTKYGNCGTWRGVERRFSSRAANVRNKGEYFRRDDDSRCFYGRRKNYRDEGYYWHDWAPANDQR